MGIDAVGVLQQHLDQQHDQHHQETVVHRIHQGRIQGIPRHGQGHRHRQEVLRQPDRHRRAERQEQRHQGGGIEDEHLGNIAIELVFLQQQGIVLAQRHVEQRHHVIEQQHQRVEAHDFVSHRLETQGPGPGPGIFQGNPPLFQPAHIELQVENQGQTHHVGQRHGESHQPADALGLELDLSDGFRGDDQHHHCPDQQNHQPHPARHVGAQRQQFRHAVFAQVEGAVEVFLVEVQVAVIEDQVRGGGG